MDTEDVERGRGRWALAALLALVLAACSGSGPGEVAEGTGRGGATGPGTTGAAPAPSPSASASTPAASSTGPPATKPATVSTTAPTSAPVADGPVVTPLPRAGLDLQIPPVAGFTYVPEPDQAVPWLQLALPAGGRGLSFGVREAGVPIGTLVVVDGISHSRYLDQLFAAPVGIVRDVTAASTGTLYLTNAALARWHVLAATPVVAATLPDAGLGQWVWRHDDRTWIALGSTAVERWAAGVVAAQQTARQASGHDYSEVGGTLYDGLPIVPPYRYVDSPVADTVTRQDESLAGGCARRLYTGSVVAVDDPAPLTAEPTDLVLQAATISGHCRDEGWFSALDAQLVAMGFVDDVVGDVPVRRRDDSLVVVDGDDVFHLFSATPETLVSMTPFITAFVTGELPPDVTDDATLPVGTCLFREASPSGDAADRHTFAVGCGEPHQGEVFHRFDATVSPGEPYPGDGEASRRADAGCAAAFETFVGVPHAASRLGYLYFYPSADTWAVGDRSVMCIVHGGPDELFRASLAGSAQ